MDYCEIIAFLFGFRASFLPFCRRTFKGVSLNLRGKLQTRREFQIARKDFLNGRFCVHVLSKHFAVANCWPMCKLTRRFYCVQESTNVWWPFTRTNLGTICCTYDFVYDTNIERLYERYDSKNEFVYCLVSSLS
jgi:hypothetical protein